MGYPSKWIAAFFSGLNSKHTCMGRFPPEHFLISARWSCITLRQQETWPAVFPASAKRPGALPAKKFTLHR
jgi:hypothetical protein